MVFQEALRTLPRGEWGDQDIHDFGEGVQAIRPASWQKVTALCKE